MSASVHIRRPVGIDLGTTNSVIAQLDDSAADLLVGRIADRLTFPSLVGWDDRSEKFVTGPDAQTLVNAASRLPLSSVKRHMGLDRRFSVGPRELTAVEASALILRSLRDGLARTLTADPRTAGRNWLIDNAIITMPAYFNHNQIEATRQAGEQAGFGVLELLHEPTAAAIYYSWLENHDDATYLVYDLGGGTFDVSVIRRRLGDHEVLSVSGDSFLGGDDFDRLLASWLLEHGTWKRGSSTVRATELHAIFDPATPVGAVPFARVVRIAEQLKIELSGRDSVERFIPRVMDLDGEALSAEVAVTRTTFHRLIRDKITRTVDCCHEALARARLQADEIDHVILVGGSSRLPLVREVVQTAFANPTAPRRARSSRILLHEPDLCVAYGAALRAAGHGTRYRFRVAASKDVELHITSPNAVRDTLYPAAGVVRQGDAAFAGGASVRVRSLASGLVEEAFLDDHGGFSCSCDLQAEKDNAIEWTVCDPDGRALALPTGGEARVVTTVRHLSQGRPLGRGVLPTQLITRPLSIEVLTRARQRVNQIIAPVGATLPGRFKASCRTSDQTGRIVVPIFEDNRVVKQLVIEGVARDVPVGATVEIEFAIDIKHKIEVRVQVPASAKQRGRLESATIEPPPPPTRPTRNEIDATLAEIEQLLAQLTGRHRARVKARSQQLRDDLLEALSYDDEPRAIQRMAELRDLVAFGTQVRDQKLDPPWTQFTQLVRRCLELAADVARVSGRDREELLQHVHTQERYAEQAYEDHNLALYRECWDNLQKYAAYLAQLAEGGRLGAASRQPTRPTRSPEEEARAEVDEMRNLLSAVWKQASREDRADLEERLAEIGRQAGQLPARVKSDPLAATREARRLSVEVRKIQARLDNKQPEIPPDHGGLLEGSA